MEDNSAPGGEILSFDAVPGPGHPSTKIEANKGIGSDYVADKTRDSKMPSMDTMNKVNSIFQRIYKKGY